MGYGSLDDTGTRCSRSRYSQSSREPIRYYSYRWCHRRHSRITRSSRMETQRFGERRGFHRYWSVVKLKVGETGASWPIFYVTIFLNFPFKFKKFRFSPYKSMYSWLALRIFSSLYINY